MKLKKAVITKAFTRWGRAYAIGETVEDRAEKIGVLVHERKARFLKMEQAAPVKPAPVAKPEPQPEPRTPNPEPESAAFIQPDPPPAPVEQTVTATDTEPVTYAVRDVEGKPGVFVAPESTSAFSRPRKGKPKPE